VGLGVRVRVSVRVGVRVRVGVAVGVGVWVRVGVRVNVLLALSVLLTTHYSLLTTHYSPLTTYYSLLTTHDSPLTTYYSLLTTYLVRGESALRLLAVGARPLMTWEQCVTCRCVHHSAAMCITAMSCVHSCATRVHSMRRVFKVLFVYSQSCVVCSQLLSWSSPRGATRPARSRSAPSNRLRLRCRRSQRH
jgi:hypothetical protein